MCIKKIVILIFGFLIFYNQSQAMEFSNLSMEEFKIIIKKQDQESDLNEIFSNVHCRINPTKYERILMTLLRDKNSSTKVFRNAAKKIGELLVAKVVDCIETVPVEIETPVAKCVGEVLNNQLDFVSIMRSGDALLDIFIEHFPKANISKILVQRDEMTAKAIFKYMKLSSTLGQDHPVIITEPMIATGGTLSLVIGLLKEQGVRENNIIVASICAAPEGIFQLVSQFPEIHIVVTALDEKLNEKKYIVPGLGDFGDRFFGTY